MMDDIEIDFSEKKPALGSTSQKPTTPQPLNMSEKIGSDSFSANGVLSQFDFRRSSHPIACIFHMLFKGLALVM